MNLLVIEHLAHVPFGSRPLPCELLGQLGPLGKILLIRIAEGLEPNIPDVLQPRPAADVVFTPPAYPDNGDVDPVVGPDYGGIRFRAEAHATDGDAGATDQSLLDKCSSFSHDIEFSLLFNFPLFCEHLKCPRQIFGFQGSHPSID